MRFIPSRFWLTKGKGESDVSALVAFDKVLIEAGIGNQNHILVSSVPPKTEIQPVIDSFSGTTFIHVNNKKQMLPFSSNIHVVRAKRVGIKGEKITAAIALAKISMEIHKHKHSFFLAYEKSGKKSELIAEAAKKGVAALVENRKATLDTSWNDNGYKVISETLEITRNYGACGVFVVFDPYTYKNAKSDTFA